MISRTFLTGLLIIISSLGIAGCFFSSNDGSVACNPNIDGPVTYLTTGNLGGDDDDPAVTVDAQGNLHIVWFSDRDGTKDLYTVHSTAFDLTTGTITWSDPVQLTNNDPSDFSSPGQGDNFPSLFIDETGLFHLAWHRQVVYRLFLAL